MTCKECLNWLNPTTDNQNSQAKFSIISAEYGATQGRIRDVMLITKGHTYTLTCKHPGGRRRKVHMRYMYVYTYMQVHVHPLRQSNLQYRDIFF